MPLDLSPQTTHSIFWFLSLVLCEEPFDWVLLLVPGVVLCCRSRKPLPLTGTKELLSSGTLVTGVTIGCPRTGGSLHGGATRAMLLRGKPNSKVTSGGPVAPGPCKCVEVGGPKNPEPPLLLGGAGHKPPATRHTARALWGRIMVSVWPAPVLKLMINGFSRTEYPSILAEPNSLKTPVFPANSHSNRSRATNLQHWTYTPEYFCYQIYEWAG